MSAKAVARAVRAKAEAFLPEAKQDEFAVAYSPRALMRTYVAVLGAILSRERSDPQSAAGPRAAAALL